MGISIQQYRAVIGSFNSIMYFAKKYDMSCGRLCRSGNNNSLKLTGLVLSILLITVIVSNISSNDSVRVNPTRMAVLKGTLSESNYLILTGQAQESWAAGKVDILKQFYSYRSIPNKLVKSLNGNISKKRGIKICTWNKGNSLLINRMPEIKNIINQHKPLLFGISEARFREKDDKNSIEISDYQFHPCLTKNQGDVRALVYTHKDLVVSKRLDLMSDEISSVWLEVGLPNTKKILVCQMYREWQRIGETGSDSVDNQLKRWNIFLDQWEEALNSDKEVIVFGDINLNFLNWTAANLSKSNQSYKLRHLISALFTRIFPLGVSQLVTGATRHFPGQESSGLDHLYTNRPEKISPIQKFQCGGSDHMVICAVRYTKASVNHPKYICRRRYRNFDQDKFTKMVNNLSWEQLLNCEDIDTVVNMFTTQILQILDELAPMKKIQLRSNYSPWISNETLDMMKNRDALHRYATLSQSHEDYREYKKLRNKINNRLKYEEKKWQSVKLSEIGSNSAKTWKTLKGILGWKSSGPPSKLFYKGSLHTKAIDIANSQNEFFVEKINNIKAELPPAQIDPLGLLRKLMKNRKCTFQMKSVTLEDVEKIINSLSNSSAFGLDNLDTQIIKLIGSEILTVITYIVNLSIKTKKFPHSWKQIKVIPLHKKDGHLTGRTQSR